MRTLAVLLSTLLLCLVALKPTGRAQPAPPANTMQFCGGTYQMRTTLYFGLSHPSGTISESQWQIFLRDEVTPRFPDGLTVWEANGQWRRSDGHIGRERAKVLLLVHEEKPPVRAAITEIVSRYKQNFHQESVLWETAPVCAAF